MQGDKDAGVMFAATRTNVLKYNDQLGVVQNINLADESYAEFQEITMLALSNNSVFVTARKGEKYFIIKLNKKTLNSDDVTMREIASGSGIPYALVADESHVYSGHAQRFGQPALVKRWDHALSDKVTDLVMPQGCDDVRGIEFNARYDSAHLYANCFTSPGMVVKVQLDGFQVAVAGFLRLRGGENKLLSGAEQDENFIFVGTATSPGRVVKIQKSDMSHQGALKLEDDENIVAAMDSDYLSIYAATNTLPAKVVRINKQTMQAEARVALDFSSTVFEQDGISAITHAGNRLYVGADMTPPRFQKLNPGSFYVPQDCALGPWGGWSDCDASAFGRSCGRGMEQRSRNMTQPRTPGGEPCVRNESHPFLLNEKKMCSMETACSNGSAVHNCPRGSGLEWSTTVFRKDGEASGSRPRCSDRVGNFEAVNSLAECACPAGRPYWMGHHKCANATQCDAANEVECSHVKCVYVAGRVKVSHHRNESYGGGFACRHSEEIISAVKDPLAPLIGAQLTEGRVSECKCFCQTKIDSPSDALYNATEHPDHPDPRL
eukprot:g30.t1